MRTLLTSLLLLAGCSSEAPAPAADATRPSPHADEVTLLFEPDAGGQPIVAATIEGRPVRLLVDTGAGATIVSATLLGAPAEQWRTLTQLCLGQWCFEGLRAWARDTPFSRPEPGAINGLLGMSPLRQFTLEMDHDRGLVLSRTGRRCAGSSLALTLDEEARPHVIASIDGRDLGAILLDTGTVYTLLSGQNAMMVDYLAENAVSTGACSIDGCTETGSFTSTARRFCVGDTCLDAVAVKYPAWDAVGNSFLRAFRVIMDFPGRRLTLCR